MPRNHPVNATPDAAAPRGTAAALFASLPKDRRCGQPFVTSACYGEPQGSPRSVLGLLSCRSPVDSSAGSEAGTEDAELAAAASDDGGNNSSGDSTAETSGSGSEGGSRSSEVDEAVRDPGAMAAACSGCRQTAW